MLMGELLAKRLFGTPNGIFEGNVSVVLGSNNI
jgi:hypothetical protein